MELETPPLHGKINFKFPFWFFEPFPYRRAIYWSVHVGWEGLICLMDRSGLLLPFGCMHYHIIFWTRDSLPLVSICICD